MESLPPELIITIIKNLSAQDCRNLIDSTPAYAWLDNDSLLWRFLAGRDLDYSAKVFDELRMATSRSPAEIYQHISRCAHPVEIKPTIFVQPCGKPIFPGTSFCRDHCNCHNIMICPYCEVNLVNVVNHTFDQIKRLTPIYLDEMRFCRTCQETRAWKNGCMYVYETPNLLPPANHVSCGYKRSPGSTFCMNHRHLLFLNP
jgi:hypothetical protein